MKREKLDSAYKTAYTTYKREKAYHDRMKDDVIKLAESMKHLKPWRIGFGANERIMIVSSTNESTLAEFVEICNIVEEHFDIILDKSFEGWIGEGHEYMNATDRFHIDGKAVEIDIRKFNIDKCEVEYVDEVVKKPVVSGFCAEVLKKTDK